jgi:hypothetical protein
MKTRVKKKRAKPKKAVKKRAFKDDDIPDLSNDPYFVKKDEETRAFLKSTGIVFDEEY